MRKQRHTLRDSHIMALGTVTVLMASVLVILFMVATW
jgi:hypothetical protein